VHCCPRAPGWGRIVVCLGAPVALQSLVYASGGSDLCRTEGCGVRDLAADARTNSWLSGIHRSRTRSRHQYMWLWDPRVR
jgi:hypothetical protein